MTNRTPLLVLALCALMITPAAANPDHDERALARQLDLTPEQRTKVRAIQDALRKSQARVRADIEVTSIDLRRELEKDSPDEARAGKLVEKVAQLEGALRKDHIVSTLRIKKLLDKDQRARLERMQGRTMMPPLAPSPAAPTPPVPPVPPTPFDHDSDDDWNFDFDFDFDLDDLDAQLTPEIRREIEREMQRARRDIERAQEDVKRARGEAMREARRAMKQAEKDMRKAMKEAERHRHSHRHGSRSSRSSSDSSSSGGTMINRQNTGGKGDGRLHINATAPADLYIDGKKIGTTPLVRSLRPGRHKLEARWPDGKRKQLSLVVSAGDTVQVMIRQPN